ncbi:amino acid permease [Gordonia sp. CPCC 205333]|uniref:amino acid permease n=1 Tax=Gordonia sp. CPCC 205333 TaxID=3140790 RepID=UPI003AF35192
MTVSSVASLRPAPTMAVYGLACVFLYVLPAIVFLVPTALVSAELASGWSGGVYRWVTEGISPNMGFAAAWHQFAMTIFYYPTLLSFVASTLAYVINPELASSGVFTAVVIIVFYWAGVLLALRGGIGVIAKLASSGVLIGTLVPGAAGYCFSPARQSVCGADERQPHLPRLDWNREHSANRQQLRGLLRYGDERGTCQRA